MCVRKWPWVADMSGRRMPLSLRCARLLLVGGGFFLLGPSALAHSPAGAPAPASAMEFSPPAPGSYRLERIMPAADGAVLDDSGKPRRLTEFTGGKVTLLSFMYTSCADVNGCPYAVYVLHQIKSWIGREPALAGKVRLVSLSFDPKRDTPTVMKMYGRDLCGSGKSVEWNFLTTNSLRELLPILDEYGQDVALELDERTGESLGTLSHLLKVFLIDHVHQVREIYSTSYLLPEMVFNDIKTLLLENGKAGLANTASQR